MINLHSLWINHDHPLINHSFHHESFHDEVISMRLSAFVLVCLGDGVGAARGHSSPTGRWPWAELNCVQRYDFHRVCPPG